MATISLDQHDPQVLESPSWPLLQRIAFRFVFWFILLYNLPAPFTMVSGAPIEELWKPLTSWAGHRFFHLTVDYSPSGSGDTTAEWIRLLCCLVITTALTIVWSLVDRQRPHYERLQSWLRVYARFVVAFAMITYGADKVIPVQFPAPNLMRLQERIGEASPMGLLWTFMGASPAYTIFAGSVELLGGLLLTMRRTSLLGALVSIGALSNVAALNYFYDVPVKLYSTDLLLLSMFVAAFDTRRLIDFFLRNRTTPQPRSMPLIGNHRLATAVQIVKAIVVIAAVWVSLAGSYRAHSSYQINTRAPLYGQWNVTEWDVDGKSMPRVIGDVDQWRQLTIENNTAAIVDNADSSQYCAFKYNASAISLSPNDGSAGMTFTYIKPASSELYLSGTVDGKRVQVRLHRQIDSDYLLVNRGFHWINEQPYNR